MYFGEPLPAFELRFEYEGQTSLRFDLRPDQREHIGRTVWGPAKRHHLYAVFLQWSGRWGYRRAKLHAARPCHAHTNTYHDGYTQLHAWLVCGCAPPECRGPLGWRLFPGQWKVLCHGRALFRRGGQRLHSSI